MKVNMYPHPNPNMDGWYILDYRPNGAKGKRIREPVEGYEQAVITRAELEGKAPNAEVISFPRLKDVVCEYLAWVEKTKSPATSYNKRQRLTKHIIPALGDYRVKELSQLVLDRYGANMKPSVYLKDVHHLSAFIAWMVKRRYATKPDWVPEQQKVNAKVKRLPRMIDAERCIAAIPREDHRIMCRLMLYAGLRWNEVRNLRWENYDTSMDLVPVEGQEFGKWERASTVIARTTKNGNEEVVSVPSNCHEWFDLHRQEKGLIFEGAKKNEPMTRISYSLKLAGKATGVKMTPHMFRHVSGTELYRRTRDIFKVMQHLRHQNLKDTMIYVRYAAIWQRESVETLVR